MKKDENLDYYEYELDSYDCTDVYNSTYTPKNWPAFLLNRSIDNIAALKILEVSIPTTYNTTAINFSVIEHYFIGPDNDPYTDFFDFLVTPSYYTSASSLLMEIISIMNTVTIFTYTGSIDPATNKITFSNNMNQVGAFFVIDLTYPQYLGIPVNSGATYFVATLGIRPEGNLTSSISVGAGCSALCPEIPIIFPIFYYVNSLALGSLIDVLLPSNGLFSNSTSTLGPQLTKVPLSTRTFGENTNWQDPNPDRWYTTKDYNLTGKVDFFISSSFDINTPLDFNGGTFSIKLGILRKVDEFDMVIHPDKVLGNIGDYKRFIKEPLRSVVEPQLPFLIPPFDTSVPTTSKKSYQTDFPDFGPDTPTITREQKIQAIKEKYPWSSSFTNKDFDDLSDDVVDHYYNTPYVNSDVNTATANTATPDTKPKLSWDELTYEGLPVEPDTESNDPTLSNDELLQAYNSSLDRESSREEKIKTILERFPEWAKSDFENLSDNEIDQHYKTATTLSDDQKNLIVSTVSNFYGNNLSVPQLQSIDWNKIQPLLKSEPKPQTYKPTETEIKNQKYYTRGQVFSFFSDLGIFKQFVNDPSLAYEISDNPTLDSKSTDWFTAEDVERIKSSPKYQELFRNYLMTFPPWNTGTQDRSPTGEVRKRETYVDQFPRTPGGPVWKEKQDKFVKDYADWEQKVTSTVNNMYETETKSPTYRNSLIASLLADPKTKNNYTKKDLEAMTTEFLETITPGTKKYSSDIYYEKQNPKPVLQVPPPEELKTYLTRKEVLKILLEGDGNAKENIRKYVQLPKDKPLTPDDKDFFTIEEFNKLMKSIADSSDQYTLEAIQIPGLDFPIPFAWPSNKWGASRYKNNDFINTIKSGTYRKDNPPQGPYQKAQTKFEYDTNIWRNNLPSFQSKQRSKAAANTETNDTNILKNNLPSVQSKPRSKTTSS